MAVDLYADGTGGSGTCADPWNNVKNRYLGLKFTINGKTHFGWARLNVTCITTFSNHQITGLLTGYAYETIPNKRIVTGVKKSQQAIASVRTAPAPDAATARVQTTLGLLAQGSAGVATWRPERLINSR
jgi:hypothetical protein